MFNLQRLSLNFHQQVLYTVIASRTQLIKRCYSSVHESQEGEFYSVKEVEIEVPNIQNAYVAGKH